MVILDTNIIIDHLRQTKPGTVLDKVVTGQVSKDKLAISIVSVQELYEGQSTKDKRKEGYLLATIAPLKVLPYTYEIAQLAGEIARDCKYNIGLADAAIAATAIINDSQLVTLNKKHFQGIKDLVFFKDS